MFTIKTKRLLLVWRVEIDIAGLFRKTEKNILNRFRLNIFSRLLLKIFDVEISNNVKNV